MTNRARFRPWTGKPRASLLVILIAGVALLGFLAVGSLTPRQQDAEVATPQPTSIQPTVVCERESRPVPALASDPCPEAITAVELAVAPVRLPIERIAIEPGPLYCDVIWPGVQSTPPCRGAAVLPGQFMHAWVAFTGSDKVAVVMLGLDLPDNLDRPLATRPPWKTTLVATDVPPAGWVMP